MKFGVYNSIADPPAGENIARCIEEVLEEAQLAEECGFDSYFFGEHHQDKDGFFRHP
jgi:alkanesulfonate monooxygenase SsuD/methylene tetrahydromethanopterin reductase-like flavin-dependent oxidoreductase (luciferase family)